MTDKDKQQLARSLVEFHTTLLAVSDDKQLGDVDDLIVRLVSDVERIMRVRIRSLLDEMHADLVR
jgi:hypothetical protein